jgi:hypothetical protein
LRSTDEGTQLIGGTASTAARTAARVDAYVHKFRGRAFTRQHTPG